MHLEQTDAMFPPLSFHFSPLPNFSLPILGPPPLSPSLILTKST